MYHNNILKVLSIVLLLFEICFGLADDKYIFTLYNKRLQGYIYMVLENRLNVAYCLIDCSNYEQCESANYNQGRKICELNRLAEEAAIKNISPSQGWNFYKKEKGVSFTIQFNIVQGEGFDRSQTYTAISRVRIPTITRLSA